MTPGESNHELLLRHLDHRLSPAERERVAALLRTDAEARAFLRDVAEQAVVVADLERTALSRQGELLLRSPVPPSKPGPTRIVRVAFRGWLQPMAAAAAIIVLAIVVLRTLPTAEKPFVRVTKVTGSSQFFGSDGKVDNVLEIGTVMGAGDTLETRSCDALIELALEDGATLTIAGNSSLRILHTEANRRRFKLARGSLWMSPRPGGTGHPVLIDTPTFAVETRNAQLDLQSSPSEAMLRVNQGAAVVEQHVDATTADVASGFQVVASLNRRGALAVAPQPTPIDFWACDFGRVPEVILGNWLPPRGNERARLGAVPLLWPRQNRDPVLLYAVAVAAWKSTEHPVLLRSDSTLRIRGRTEKAQMVRFGFSTQKMRDVFAGKFETDVQPSALGPAGETWEVELPLASFRPLQPQLSASPDGLELTDIYALTIKEDADLEINHIELVPAR